MSRAQRLLDLIQVLRRHRMPVNGAALAQELAISLRSLYRDIETLRGQGAHIDGEPGIGYVLRPGFMLPPMMFSEDEIEALVLGSRWVSGLGDLALSAAARNALAKIGAVLPADLKERLETSTLLIGKAEPPAGGNAGLPLIRDAIRRERRMVIGYADAGGSVTSRAIWPIALGFFERARVIVAWCELRRDFRHFRTDRVRELGVTEARYPKRRAALLKDWRAQQGIPGQ